MLRRVLTRRAAPLVATYLLRPLLGLRRRRAVRQITRAIGSADPRHAARSYRSSSEKARGSKMFGKSWTVACVRGIPIRLHVSLLLFLPYVAFASSVQYRQLARSVGFDPRASALPPI